MNKTKLRQEVSRRLFSGNINKADTKNDLYKRAAVTVKERLNKDAKTPPKDSLLGSLRFYTREEQLSEYVCLACNRGYIHV